MFPTIRQALYAALMPPLPVAVKNLPQKNLSDALAIFFRHTQTTSPIAYMNHAWTGHHKQKLSATTYGATTPPGNPLKKTITCLSESGKDDIPQTGTACNPRKRRQEAPFREKILLECGKPGTHSYRHCLATQIDRLMRIK